MFIISKQSDYYDCIMKQGLDKSIIYHRNEQCQVVSRYSNIYRYFQKFQENTINDYIHLPNIKQNISVNGYLKINTGLLGFCGKQYLIIICQHQDKYFSSCVYHRWIDNLKQAKLTDYDCSVYELMYDYLMKKHKQYPWQRRSIIEGKEKEILTLLSKQNGLDIPHELFIELDCPVFFVYQSHNSYTTLIKNPMLKILDFQCIFNPQQCFQEIAMYIGNFLNQKDNPEQITDNKVLCAAKGFDVKTSFRKPPNKK